LISNIPKLPSDFGSFFRMKWKNVTCEGLGWSTTRDVCVKGETFVIIEIDMLLLKFLTYFS